MLGDEFSIHYDIGPWRTEVSSGTLTLFMPAEKLGFYADGEALVELHAFRRLRMQHGTIIFKFSD